MFESQDIFYHLDNYDLFTASLQEGRGVILYIRNSLSAEQIWIDSEFKESVWCHVKLTCLQVVYTGAQ